MHRQRDIVVFGSHVYGSYINCERIPRPGETVVGSGYKALVLDDGGKGSNQAMCATRLGAAASLISAIGADEAGEAGMEILAREGCDISHVIRSETHPTGVSLAAIDRDGTSIIITDPGANEELDFNAARASENVIAEHKFCLMQFENPKGGALEAFRAAGRHGVRAMLTPGPMVALQPDDLEGLDIIIPNETEAAELLGVGAVEDFSGAAKEICQRWGIANAIITCGSRGALAYWENELVAVPAFPVAARNTIGAGDGFAAATAFSLCRGLGIDEALRFAAAVGALSVMHPGAPWSSYPGLPDVLNFLMAHGETVLCGKAAACLAA